MNLAEFVAQWNGKFVTAPGGIGGQCVDVPNEYGLQVYGFPHEWKNAIDWFGFDSAHWAWVKNDAGNAAQFPEPGDVVVWGPNAAIGTGPYGHIDIFLDGTGYSFHGFDQNWPVGSPAHVQSHDYRGVIGWAKPVVPAPPTPPQPIPAPVPVPIPVPAPVPTPPEPPQPLPEPIPPLPPGQPGAPPEVPPVATNPPVVVVEPVAAPLPVPSPPVAEPGQTTTEFWIAIGSGASLILGNILIDFHVVALTVTQQTDITKASAYAIAAIAAGYALARGIRKAGTTA